MRVLLVTDWLRRRGGVETYFAMLREGLREAGHEVALLTSSVSDRDDASSEFRAFGTERLAAQAFLQVSNPLAARATRRAVAAFRPDVALVGMFEQHLSPAIFTALGSVPIVVSIADYKPICPTHTKLLPSGALCDVRAGRVCIRNGCLSRLHWLRDQPRYSLIHRALARASHVLACSAWLQAALARDGIASESLVLPTPTPAATLRRMPATEPLFVFVGRLSPEKGVSSLLRAFAALRDRVPAARAARLRIVGDGAQRLELEQLARALGIDDAATFTGWLDRAGIDGELSPSWAAVAPSLWAEPYGLVAVEAIVRGVPVVASAQGGLAEMVSHGTSGLLFENGDEDELGACLQAIATGSAFPDHELPASVIEETRKRSSLEAHIARLEAVFADAIR